MGEIYINVDKLIQDLRDNAAEAFNAIVNAIILGQPAADVAEVKHGEWQIGMEYGAEIYTCSECGLDSADTSNFCPNCGADMRGDTE